MDPKLPLAVHADIRGRVIGIGHAAIAVRGGRFSLGQTQQTADLVLMAQAQQLERVVACQSKRQVGEQ
jgi:hypothetical protein